jgi:hypothetical protein
MNYIYYLLKNVYKKLGGPLSIRRRLRILQNAIEKNIHLSCQDTHTATLNLVILKSN